MIQRLHLKEVGPAREMAFEFAPRLNVLTGDNGLGKTFVLDVLWWTTTCTWAGESAFPRMEASPAEPADAPGSHRYVSPWLDDQNPPQIDAMVLRDSDAGGLGRTWLWDRKQQAWVGWDSQVGTINADLEVKYQPQTLMVYARIDGSFAIWDACYVKGTAFADAAIILPSSEVWDGKVSDSEIGGGKRTVINGLIADWVNWQQRASSPEFEVLRQVLLALSSPDEPLIPGEPTRVRLDDRRDIPTLTTAHGVVPVTLASAGMKRALALAYLLVWTWTEHTKAAKQRRTPPTRDIVLLIDEPELHLHPAWQRVFLPAVMRAVSLVAPEAAVQVFTATHSPLVLASLESVFQEDVDDLFLLERDGRIVRATELTFGKKGDVSNWLASEVFGGIGGRSREAELAIAAAMDFMAERVEDAEKNLARLTERLKALPNPPPADEHPERPLVERIHEALQATLPGLDDFWPHWTLAYRPRGIRATR